MTAYNREKYIGEAIESVLKSTYENWELIIVDDGSKDNTVSIVKSFVLLDKRIRFYENKRNLGDYPNRNCAANYALGKYIVFVDSDDRMFSDALEHWVAAMNENNVKFGIFAKMGNDAPVVLQPEETICTHFFKKPILSFGPVATITERNYFKEQKGFPERYGPANDMYHHIKLAASTDTLVFNVPLVDYRLHDAQELNNPYGYLYNNYNYLKDVLAEINLPLSKQEYKFLSDKNKRRFLINAFQYAKRTGEFHKTFKAFKNAEFTISDFLKAIFH